MCFNVPNVWPWKQRNKVLAKKEQEVEGNCWTAFKAMGMLLRRALGGAGERSKWMREATGSAQSTLALGTRRNYSSLHNRSEHSELTRWPSADVTVGGCSSYIDCFHFLKQGDPEGSLGLSHRDHWGNTVRVWKHVLCLKWKWGWSAFPLTASFNDHPLPEGQRSWNAGFDQRQTFVPRVQQREVKTREWRGFGVDHGSGVGRGRAAREGLAWQQHELMGLCGRGFQTSEEHAQSVRDLGRHLSRRSGYENEWQETDKVTLCTVEGFPGGTSGKELDSQYRRQKKRGFHPWVGKIPWRREWLPHSRTLAWRISWTEEPRGLRSIGSQCWTRLNRLRMHTL